MPDPTKNAPTEAETSDKDKEAAMIAAELPGFHNSVPPVPDPLEALSKKKDGV